MNPPAKNCINLCNNNIIKYRNIIFSVFIFHFWGISSIFSQQKPIHSSPSLLKGNYLNDKSIAGSTASQHSLLINKRTLSENCNSTTFYLRIPSGAKKSVVLEDIETMPDGSYIISASAVKADNTKVGLLISLSNDGAVLYQRELKVNNQEINLSKIKVRYDGSLIISGIMTDGTNEVFIADLNNDLSIRWLQTFQMPSQPLKITADILESLSIPFAIQLSGAIVYGLLDTTGNILWQKQISPVGLQKLVGFTGMNFNKLCIVDNCLRSGRMITELHEIDDANGQMLSNHERGNGVDERVALAVGSFNNRVNLVTINKNGSTNFTFERDILYSSSLVETNHSYNPTSNLNFNFSSGAIDNSGDIMALCTAQDGKLILMNQYAHDYARLSFTTRYNVPTGSSVGAVARSFDGGILCGLTNGAQNELILIKTDSIGVLPGCGYENISNPMKEQSFVANTINSITETNTSINTVSAIITYTNSTFSAQFNCNQKYCPSVPDADTCMSTYFKTLRSNSYADIFNDYFLMRNNRQIVVTRRYDRVIGVQNTITSGLKLLDESGKFIKGVTVLMRDASTACLGYAMDDKSIMLVLNSSENNIASHTLMLISDNLDILWTKSFHGGIIGGVERESEIIMDEQKNIYLVGFTARFLGEKPRIGICKLDQMGNQVWVKKYEMEKGLFGSVAVAYSNSSLYIIIGGSGDGSASVRIDKQNGQMLNSYNFIPLWSGGILRRYARFEKDRVTYIGDDKNSNLVLASFDSTGRPSRIRTLNHSSIPRAANFSGGMSYVSYYYFNGMHDAEVLLKADTALNLVFIKEYNDMINSSRNPKNLYVSNEENIYIGGNISTSAEVYPYIMKLDKDGNRGSCNSTIPLPEFKEINPQVNALGHSSLPVNVEEHAVPVSFVPDYQGQKISNVLCQSIPQCTYFKLSGPDTICLSTQEYRYTFEKPAGCTASPQWLVDTAFLSIINITDNGATIQFKKSGLVNIYAKLNAGCSSLADSVVTLVQNSDRELSLDQNRVLCPGDTLRLSAGQGFSSYKWQDLSTDSVLFAGQSGTYTVEVTNACGDALRDTLLISDAVVPFLTLGNDTLICTGAILKLTATNGFSKYHWSSSGNIDGEGAEINVPVKQSQMLSVTALTADGCFAADTINIATKNATPFSLGNDTSFCAPGSIVFSPGTGYLSYGWNDGSTSSSFIGNKPGSYWVNATDFNGCIASDTIVIKSVHALPVVNLGKDFDLCNGTVVQLDAGSFLNYKWMDGTTARYHSANTTGRYFVKVADENGCSNSDTLTINNILLPPSDFLPATDSLCQYESIFIGTSTAFQSYTWSNGGSSSKIEVDKPENYILTVTDNNGCVGKDTISVVLKNCLSGLFIPSAFTPNGDNKNDVFRARAYGKVNSFRFEIYDRFGTMIFKTTDPKAGWDGKVNGIAMPSGVFVWQCYCQFEGSNMLYRKGNVTLLR